jgi:chromosome segregation ATPase
MNRLLQYTNLFGVAALAALCIVQWSANRRANLEARDLEKARLELTSRVERQEKDIKGQAADLESFREQFARSIAARKGTEIKLAKTEHQITQLEVEREQLKSSITNWAAAVAARDERLKEGNERIRQLGEDLNASIRKYNELGERHAKLVKDWNDQQAKLAAMRTNSASAVPR